VDLFRRRSTKAPSKEAAARGRANNAYFKPKTVAQLEQVNTKLQQLEAEITIAEAALPAIALQFCLE
jgi:hypothetical protein